MLDKNRFFRFVSVPVLIGFWIISQIVLADLDFIGVSELVRPPAQIVAGQNAFGAYRFTNNVPHRIFVDDVNSNSYSFLTNITEGGGFCGKQRTQLAPGGYCDFNFTISAQSSGTQFTIQPEKNLAGTPASYFWPIPLHIQVVDTPQSGMPALGITPSSITISAGLSGNIIVKNLSPNVIANSVQAAISPKDENIDMNGSILKCVSMAPKDECTLTLKTTGSAAYNSNPIPFTIQGANTYPVQASYIIEAENIGILDVNGYAIPDNLVYLSQGQSLNIQVKNFSANVANNVKLEIPKGNTDIASVIPATCAQIAGGATCNMTINVKPSASVNSYKNTLTIKGTNTFSVPLYYYIADPQQNPVQVTGPNNVATISFQTTAPQLVTVTNSDINQLPIIINKNGISLVGDGSTISGISISNNNCPVDGTAALAAGSSCTLTLNASTTSYGSGTIQVAYTKQQTPVSTPPSLPVNVQMDATYMVFVDSNSHPVIDNQANIIQQAKQSLTTFGFTNTGNFVWKKPNLDLSTNLKSAGVSIQNDNCSGHDLAPTATCQFQIQVPDSSSSVVGKAGTLIASGINITPSSVSSAINFPGNISITPDSNIEDLHLGYRAITVKNNSVGSASITSVNISSSQTLGNNVYRCGPYDNSCNYYTQSGACSSSYPYTLSSGSSCKIWFKANSNSTMGPTKLSDNRTVTVTTTWQATPSFSQNFAFNYEQSLYAGGSFGNATNPNVNTPVPVSNIAKWNGSTWSALGSGTNGTVFALNYWNGDLYVGGSFSGDPSFLGIWYGDDWYDLGTGVINGDVNTITNDGNSYLYIGGNFTQPGKFVGRSNDGGYTWYNVGQSINGSLGSTFVYALMYVPNMFSNLYNIIVGGNAQFSYDYQNYCYCECAFGYSWVTISAVTTAMNFLGFLGGADSSNIAPLIQLPGVTYCIKYCGGVFDVRCTPISNINNSVYTFANLNSNIYLGGAFTPVAGSNCPGCNHIVKYSNQGSSLVPLGGGLDSNVFALDILPLNQYLYIGGDFSTTLDSSGKVMKHIGMWDGTQWHALYGGLEGSVRAITNLNGILYIGGTFSSTSLATLAGPNITTYNPAGNNIKHDQNFSWQNIGSLTGGTSNIVNALLIAPSLTIYLSP